MASFSIDTVYTCVQQWVYLRTAEAIRTILVFTQAVVMGFQILKQYRLYLPCLRGNSLDRQTDRHAWLAMSRQKSELKSIE